VTWTHFTDRDLGKQFPAILAEAGLSVERHVDLFPPDGSDEQWLAHCGRNGRVAISHNSRIRYVPNELAAVLRFKVALLIVIGRVPMAQLARGFVTSMNAIEAFLALHAPSYIAKVYRPTSDGTVGRIELWYPKR
jgi:hypothetical protein